MNRSKAEAVIAMAQDRGLLGDEWVIAGSYRRGKKVGLHDIDLIVVCDQNGMSTHYILGERVDIVFCVKDVLGPTVLYLTGSKSFNIKMRAVAKEKGMKLNRYGLFNRTTGERLDDNTEHGIFAALGMAWKEPWERQA